MREGEMEEPGREEEKAIYPLVLHVGLDSRIKTSCSSRAGEQSEASSSRGEAAILS